VRRITFLALAFNRGQRPCQHHSSRFPNLGPRSPEGVVPAPIGKLYTDLDSLDIYQKEVGGNLTGWVKRGVAGAGGGSGTGTGGTGAGYPLYAGTTQQRNNTTPATAYAVWMLTDSTPPYQLSIWANAQWN